MEKKLTDEEIAQALLQNIEYSKTLTYFDKWGNHKAIMITDIIDFIHRLQDEKQELKSIAEYQQGSNMERWQIIQEKDKMIAEQKAEIERLTEENEYLDMCGKQFLADYQKCEIENAELQKQVDELKKSQANKYALEAIYNNGYEHAVKDTAKKFADLVEFHSVATMEDNVEYFTIYALGLKEILREDFCVEGEKMKLYKHYFDKSDTPYVESFQRKRKYHTVWKRGKYRVFLQCKVIKIKFLGIFTIYKLTDANQAEIEKIVREMKRKTENEQWNTRD